MRSSRRTTTCSSSSRDSRFLFAAKRGDRLALRDGLDELVLGHRCERVVGLALLADRRDGLGREVLAAGGSCAVGR
jgi:hypothetical protein